jgi:5-methylcytosine-specific restriction endonuclease McrA
MSGDPDRLIQQKTGGFWSEARRSWCAYCGIAISDTAKPDDETRLSRDHLIPRAHKGGFVTVPCCHACNAAKGSMSLPEFMITPYFEAARAVQRPNRASLRDLWLGIALAAVYRARALEREDPEQGVRGAK